MNVKKSVTIFRIFSFVWAAAILSAAMITNLWFVTAVFGSMVWIAMAVYYAKIQYRIEKGILTISSGLLFRRERIVPLEKVLVVTNVKFGRECVLSVLTLSGSTVIVFAEIV